MDDLSTGRFAGEPLGDLAVSPGVDASRDRLARLATQIRTQLSGLLSTQQLNRLRQIARQARGPSSFFDPDVQRLLGLTLEQKDKARAILAVARAQGRRPVTQQTPGVDAFDRFDAGAVPQTARDRALSQLAALLDAPQAAVWTGLTGRPYVDAERLDPDAVRRAAFRPGPRPFGGPGDFGGPGGPDGFGGPGNGPPPGPPPGDRPDAPPFE